MVVYQMSRHARSCLIIGLVRTTEPRYVMAAVLTNIKRCLWLTACNQRKSRTDLLVIALANLAQLALKSHVIVK